ncbi:MAG: 50S ribosomal protein L3 [Ignavibacteriae bacterium]|jgi:large subunit ribosomal protein L3|nr:50S ribosomal protein L3 [Ignavibacteriota bacterium]NOG97573.1 50S ribosomal protein L3 [Ignavibacteriota bacterium]
MPGLLGKKIGMTSIFSEEGNSIPVTAVKLGPCVVLEVKTNDKDGYDSVKLGFGEKKEKQLNKPELGFYKKSGLNPAEVVKEFRNFDEEYKVGDVINLEIFDIGDEISVSGKSIGKGFQGVMRRHGFGGVGGTTHGQKDRLRAPGSIGQSSWPSKVFKGTRMAGRTGGKRITTKNLKVVKMDAENNIIFIKGAVPGSINSIVEINK